MLVVVYLVVVTIPEPQPLIQQNTVDPEIGVTNSATEANQLNPIQPNKIESENNKS